MLGNFRLGSGDQQPAGHSQVHNPVSGEVFSRPTVEVNHNVLPRPVHPLDAGPFEQPGNCPRGRLERLWLAANPDRFDHVSGNTLGQPTGDGFNFRKFRHGRAVLSFRFSVLSWLC